VVWSTDGPPFGSNTQIAGYLVASMRVVGLILLAPPLSSLSVPATVRIACALVVSAALWPAVVVPAAVAGSAGSLLLAAALEFFNGALMALAVHIGFAAFAVGSRLVDVQIGFGIGQVLDPSTRQRLPALGATFAMAAPVLFLATNGHHVMLRALARSFERFPLGEPFQLDAAAPAVARLLQGMFTLGLAMVAPVVLCLVVIELALGVMARNLPQMNVFVLGIPVKVLGGLAALGAWTLAGTAPMTRVFEAIFDAWEASLR
jgi:flagellar biosynthesis protein FliR